MSENANKGTGSTLIGGLTWNRFTDGRPFRLKQGVHFEGDVRLVTQEARLAANALGKAVHVLREDMGRFAYVWVQFADALVQLGQPCPICGGASIQRSHAHFVRCDRCGALLLLQLPRPVFEGEPALDEGALDDEGEAMGADLAEVVGRSTEAVADRMRDLTRSKAEPRGERQRQKGEAWSEKRSAHARKLAEAEAAKPLGEQHELSQSRLYEFSDLRLQRAAQPRGRERWVGSARNRQGELVELVVDYHVDRRGHCIAHPERPGEPLYELAVTAVRSDAEASNHYGR